MYNPPRGVYRDSKGVPRLRRVHGHMQCSFPGFSVRYHRDINAAINILKVRASFRLGLALSAPTLPCLLQHRMSASFSAFPLTLFRFSTDACGAQLFHHMYEHGELPLEFRRTTDHTALLRSPAADRKYAGEVNQKGFRRL